MHIMQLHHLLMLITFIKPGLTQYSTTQQAFLSPSQGMSRESATEDASPEPTAEDALPGQFLTSIRHSVMESTTLLPDILEEVLPQSSGRY